MTIAAYAEQANANVSTASLIPSAQSLGLQSSPAVTSPAVTRTTASSEDSVHLSDSALKYLQSSQAKETQNQNFVEQLVRAAAAGDSGALSLLTVI